MKFLLLISKEKWIAGVLTTSFLTLCGLMHSNINYKCVSIGDLIIGAILFLAIIAGGIWCLIYHRHIEDQYNEIKEKESSNQTCLLDIITQPSNKYGIKELSVAVGCVDKIKEKKEKITSLKIIAVSGNVLIKLLKPIIEYAVSNKNASIQVIIGTEYSNFINEVELIEDGENRVGNISEEIKGVVGYLKEYSSNAYKNKKSHLGCIEVKKFNTQLREAITIINDEWAWVTLNLPPERCGQSLSLEFEKEGETPYINSVIKHFDEVWKSIEFIEYSSCIRNGEIETLQKVRDAKFYKVKS